MAGAWTRHAQQLLAVRGIEWWPDESVVHATAMSEADVVAAWERVHGGLVAWLTGVVAQVCAGRPSSENGGVRAAGAEWLSSIL